MKKNISSGVITFHIPLPDSLKSEDCVADVKEAAESQRSQSQQPGVKMTSVRARKRDEASQPGARRSWLSHPSLRRLQAKMEAENQQAKEMLKPLLDTENGFVKRLESFLSQRDVNELRKRELLHKRWTERVWFPFQNKLEHVSSCGAADTKRHQGLYSHFLHHCNNKGCVFLDTYDLREYNPFLLNVKKPHHCKLSTADLKDPLGLQVHERLKGKRTACTFEAGRKYKLPQRYRPLSDSLASRANTPLQVPFHCPDSASRKPLVEDDTDRRKASRLDSIPYHISASSTPDGRCPQSSCRLSRCRCRQQRASSHQSMPTSE